MRRSVTVLPLLAIGAVAGFFGGLFGLGGGVIIVPALVFLCGFNQRHAAIVSSLALLPTAVVGLTSYALHGGVDWFAGAALALGITLGSALGSRLLHRLSLWTLELCFLLFLLVAIASLWLVVPDRSATIDMSPGTFVLLVLFGTVPGVAVALLGVGGGVIAIPVLIAGFGASDIVAKGSSLLMVIVGATTTSLRHLRNRALDVKASLCVGVAAAAVTPFSVQLAVFLTPLASNILFSVFLAVIALQYTRRLYTTRTRAAER